MIKDIFIKFPLLEKMEIQNGQKYQIWQMNLFWETSLTWLVEKEHWVNIYSYLVFRIGITFY